MISVVIPCRNEGGAIEACLRGVLAFVPPPGGFEVLVVDGQSTDATPSIVSRLAALDPRVRLLDNPARMTSHALNIGIRAAQGEIIVRVDAHTEYAPDYLVECVAALERTGADNVGGPALTRARTYRHRVIAAAYHSRFAVGGSRFHQPDFEGWADTVPYGCYRRDLLIQLGLFDEELVRNQDDELNFRLLRAGGRIWLTPRIRSWYTPRAEFSRLFRQYYQYGYWRVRVIQKHRLPASPRQLVPGAFVLSLLVLALVSLVAAPAAYLLGGLISCYLVFLLCGSLVTAASAGWSILPLLPVAFATYHIAYGSGFLLGLWDFVVWSRRSSSRCVVLSR